MSLWFNLLCEDVDAQFRFYRELLGWEEASDARSPIYRALQHGGQQFGFNAAAAYRLLGLADRMPPPDQRTVTAYATFMLDTPAAVDAAAAAAARLGGAVIKPPFATYYGQWQAVLADREDQVFRVACAALPPGVTASPTPF
ncbi:VOC family protein [Aquabacterium sp. J223]|uniref:VOC family protein n=1 Tax=Aquabacterium sp. J223 TaxID=2898431 RepID=UPI0021ADD2CC|nr:VOC family protein [Aquabacterium sp. J223]UUX95576.1 VOC family protein [Aquabacterium sp. J223]